MKRPHFALPEIYDDSLSYYDVLRKLIKSMHVIADNLNKIPEQIANEAKARLLGDQNLQQNINSEATTREQADITLQQNINEESSAREQADQEIREGMSNKISELKGDLTNKLPKSPANWEPWTDEEQAVARERMGILGNYELIETIDETFNDYTFIERDKEPDGTPYNFARVYVFITMYKDSGQCGNYGSGYVYDADNNNIPEYRTELGLKTATGNNYSVFWNFGVGMNTVFSEWGNPGDRMYLRTHGNSIIQHNVAKKTCAKIVLPSFSGHVKISIWGVRA